MVRYLLDTNVLSELMRVTPNPRVVQWVDGQLPEQLYISALTIGELLRAVATLPEGGRRTRFQRIIVEELIPAYTARILPIDHAVTATWAELKIGCERHGRPLTAIDSLIAATALHHDLHLVTRNTRDFAGTGVLLVDPWE